MDESATIIYDVDNFIHGEFDRNEKPRLVHIVSTTDDGKRLILKEYIINETGHNLSFVDQDKEFFLFPMEWEGETEWVKETLSTVEELQNVLDAEANYGVWGFDQLKSFSALLPNLVNVSCHFVKVLLAIWHPQIVVASNKLPLNIGKVFRNFAVTFLKEACEALPPENVDIETSNIYRWVQNVAWPALMFWPYDSETNENEDSSYEFDESDWFHYESDEKSDGFDSENNEKSDGFDSESSKKSDKFDYESNEKSDGFVYENNGFVYESNEKSDGFVYESNEKSDGFVYESNEKSDEFVYESNEKSDGFDYESNKKSEEFDYESDEESDGFDYESDTDYLEIDVFDQRLNKLTKDTELRSRKW